MRLSMMATTALALALASTGVLAQRQLRLLVTVSDPGGAAVRTVDSKDVRITEDGADATVTKVEPVERVPKVQILIDNGLGFPNQSIGDLRKGVVMLLEALPPDIEITLVTTAPQPRFLERATKDRQRLLDAVNRLAPDSGAGRFVESLAEATERIERDTQQDAGYVIVSMGTSSGDTNVRDRDIKQIQERVLKYGAVVHVVLLNSVGRSSGGAIQGDLGQAVAKMSGGRFENIAVANRVVTLLPEIGSEMAKALGAGSRVLRVYVERPNGKSGDLGQISLGVAGKTVSSVTLDRR
jgi:hypothetical protein